MFISGLSVPVIRSVISGLLNVRLNCTKMFYLKFKEIFRKSLQKWKFILQTKKKNLENAQGFSLKCFQQYGRQIGVKNLQFERRKQELGKRHRRRTGQHAVPQQ